MKIKIVAENKMKIAAAINDSQRQARARCIDAEDVYDAVRDVEKKFDGVTKKALTGLTIKVDPNGQHFPGAYRWIPESTQLEITRTSTGWYLTKVWRDRTTGVHHYRVTRMPESVKDALVKSREMF